MTRFAAILTVALLYALHQDTWFWNEARPLIFGFLPVGLFYHVAYVLVTSLVFWGLVTYFWPSHLDE